METDEKKEIAALKRELERQRLETKAGIERICYAVNSLLVSLGEKPCSDWLKHSRENWGKSFQ